MSRFLIGDQVRLSPLGIYRKIYQKSQAYRAGHVVGYGKGPTTKDFPRVSWGKYDKEGDLLHPDFLKIAESENVAT